MIELYGWMAVSETYGDEDKDYYNAFRKFIYKKGSCTVKIDEDFSPCSPQIEE